ncbi:glycosyl hydrolase [Longispora fulva]|uniref:Alpha,alpha-trehalose phosphorylase n=1 Tax=Longispora fulva TaxID=619741 RepID=A0A8J7KPR6_9ACTN|nr:glycoside hydrolase family 65 protein [Longispora fulva]MBG6136617.1 alpha,alpha-trehalose phosphorylase [Longispora fulva]GIG59786.1 glycosyl hydrolase [Longispora fulva]
MIEHPGFQVEPWCLRETGLDLGVLAQSESVFALANGHLGWRGNLDEGEPHALPGCYLNGVHESRPLPYAEAGYGYPEAGDTVINVTNGKLLRLLVDDEPFDIRYGDLRAHERLLDFRAGTLSRTAEWTSPAGRTVRVRSTRIVSLTQRAVAAIRYEVEALDGPARVVVQSELVTNEEMPAADADPRAAAALKAPLRSEQHEQDGARVVLAHRTANSRLLVAAGMDHRIEEPAGLSTTTECRPDLGRVTATTLLRPGERLVLTKYVAYGWSGARSLPGVLAQVEAALVAAVGTGWEGLLAEQRAYLDDFWDRADVEVTGDDEIQQAVRFALFHLLQAGARGEGRAIAAKGLTGPGYDGHAFWDTEMFVLPVLDYAVPQAARQSLQWRREILPLAEERATVLGLHGAVFPWRTIGGRECSAYWPAGTAAFHLGGDIAAAVIRYCDVTGDREFARGAGLDLLAATARMWRSLGCFDQRGRFRIDGVTGPDEYSAVADNNVYTNLLARQNLLAAADGATGHPDRAAELGIEGAEADDWRAAADAMTIPYDEALGIHPQSERFTDHEIFDFAAFTAKRYPLLLHVPYFDLYRKQVVKQADLVLAMHLFPDDFTPEQKARNFAYYERLTVRDSSLSACTQAVMAAETGHLDLAYDYLGEAALMDLDDLEHNTRDGLHMASLAGSWIALVAGFGGLRQNGPTPCFTPRLPAGLTGLAFTLSLGERRLHVEVGHEAATYTLRAGESMEFRHNGEAYVLSPDAPRTLPVEARPSLRSPGQPAGRAPARRTPDP